MLRVTTTVLLLASLLACSKKDGAAPSTSASASASASASSAATATPAALNATLVEHVKAHVEKCTVNVEQGQAYSCKDKVSDELAKYVRDSKPADFASTLLALARKKDDEKLSATAIALLAEDFDNLGSEGKQKNATPGVVKEALAALQENTGNRATRLAAPAAQLATIAGSFDDLYAVADAHPTKEARDNVYRHLLTFGRLKALPKLDEVAAKRPEHAAAALDAVPRMYKATEEEKAAACPWAKGYLSNEDEKVATEAAQDMVFCKGEYIDALVQEAETRLKNKQFKDPFARVMREPCFEMIKDITKKAAADTQCETVYAFLEKVVNDASVDDKTRGLALFNIYYQRRDEKTLRLMRKYEKHPNKEIAKRAGEAIQSLTTTYKLKG